MAIYTKDQVINTIDKVPIVPVMYNPDVEVSKCIIKACYDGGMRMFEFTNRGEHASEVFKELVDFAATLPEMILGAGSISFSSDARKFIRMGANFIVGPQYVPGVMRVCKWHKVLYIPGCGTVSEVGRAQRAGCDICKVFPGDVLTPSFVKSLLAPMPWSKLMVTGGVKPTKESLEKWFTAGAASVGIGSNLFPKELVESKDWLQISSICCNALETAEQIRISKRT